MMNRKRQLVISLAEKGLKLCLNTGVYEVRFFSKHTDKYTDTRGERRRKLKVIK